jgi:hypothetical protein
MNCQYLQDVWLALRRSHADVETTHGFGDRHCQKLYGRGISKSLSFAPENGIAASPPFEDGDGRWSRATFNNTN